MLSVKQHNELLTQQFLLACHDPRHSNFEVVNREMPLRCIRSDLRSFSDRVTPHIPNPINPTSLRSAMKTIHTNSVSTATSHSNVNRVLGTRPPKVDKSEETLPRATLAQLRSGFCNLLQNYRARVIPSTPDACPDCNQGPHDTAHLFNFPGRPTNLTSLDLWAKPKEVARFLNLDLT